MNDLPPENAPISPKGLPKEYDDRIPRLAQLSYDFVIEPDPAEVQDKTHAAELQARADAALLCWDAEKREWLTWAQWIFNRQPR